jgi:exonuclease VII large subunit
MSENEQALKDMSDMQRAQLEAIRAELDDLRGQNEALKEELEDVSGARVVARRYASARSLTIAHRVSTI